YILFKTSPDPYTIGKFVGDHRDYFRQVHESLRVRYNNVSLRAYGVHVHARIQLAASTQITTQTSKAKLCLSQRLITLFNTSLLLRGLIANPECVHCRADRLRIECEALDLHRSIRRLKLNNGTLIEDITPHVGHGEDRLAPLKHGFRREIYRRFTTTSARRCEAALYYSLHERQLDEVPNPNNPDIILISDEGEPGNHEQPEERVEDNSSSTVNIVKKSN
ncbi:unnamed protein product, partial [Trichogramma brassicae]